MADKLAFPDTVRLAPIVRTAQRLFGVAEVRIEPLAPDAYSASPSPTQGFLASCVLYDEPGMAIGTLTVADPAPRTWTDADADALRDLGVMAEAELQRHSLEQSGTRLHTLVENIADGIITLDQYGLIVSMNRAASRIFGYRPDEVIGKNIRALMPARYHETHDGYLQNFRDTGKTRVIGMDREVTGQRKDGSQFPMELTVNEMWLQGRRGFTGIIRDVTERKRVEKIKRDFISTVSHELRTPLTSIRGSIGLLSSGVMGEIPPRAQELLAIASTNCERLVRLVSDILDTEKIESGHMNFTFAVQPMLPLVEQACAATQDFAAQYNVRFEIRVDDDVRNARVKADGDRLVQVIVNLLSNAAKFSPPDGSVQVQLSRTGSGGDRLRLSVIDHGPGIVEAFRERVFQKFAQADVSDARQKGGTGLGLSISLAIVERHHGRIDFLSTRGRGCEFFFELPLAAAEKP